jgi:hypothetical protein
MAGSIDVSIGVVDFNGRFSALYDVIGCIEGDSA